MPFKIASQEEMRDLIVALGKALFPEANYGSRQTYHGRRATYLAGSVTELSAHVASAQRDLHPLTAGDGKPINDWGAAVGVERKTATPARRSAAGRVRGAATATASIGEQLRHEESGLIFELAGGVTIPGIITDPDSFVDVDIVGVDVGSRTRLSAGETLNFLETPLGLETGVVLQLDLDEDGFDAEQFGSYRQRTIATFGQSASGGSQDEFARWTLESLNTIAKSYAYPNRAGKGSIDVVGFHNGTGTARSLTPDERDAVKSYIQTKAPFQVSGLGGPLRVLETIADPRDVEITIETNGKASFNFDWNDSTPPTVLSWNATDRELQLSALPASVRAGHRLILVGVASVQDGREYKIESISGADTVILERAPINPPLATDLIYSGGPLVKPIRDAIVAHLNGQTVYAGRGLLPLAESAVQSAVGLDILAEGIGSANPEGLFGEWTGGVLLSNLFGIVKYKAGVRNLEIVTPAADYEAEDDAFPLDDQIHYVTAGAVVIRKA